MAKSQYLWFLLGLSLFVKVNYVTGSGYNAYKDFLRAKIDDDEDLVDLFTDDAINDKLYFYRAPVSAYQDLTDPVGKRTVNKFKNMMLTKDMDSLIAPDIEKEIINRFYIPRTIPKRGAILSWAIPAANRVREMSINYRPPGFNRPAA